MSTRLHKGFTLIELLIVIGILAVLATVTVLVLNPAQLFAQARDSQRISDISTIRDAISLYVAVIASPDLDDAVGVTGSFACSTNFGSSLAAASSSMTAVTIGANAAAQAVNASGWIPVDFTDVAAFTGATPISSLPRDPTNAGVSAAVNGLYYQYSCDNSAKTFELNANLESTRYTSGAENKENSDGGNNSAYYEIGSAPGLTL